MTVFELISLIVVVNLLLGARFVPMAEAVKNGLLIAAACVGILALARHLYLAGGVAL